jgi:hypothetical protein
MIIIGLYHFRQTTVDNDNQIFAIPVTVCTEKVTEKSELMAGVKTLMILAMDWVVSAVLAERATNKVQLKFSPNF